VEKPNSPPNKPVSPRGILSHPVSKAVAPALPTQPGTDPPRRHLSSGCRPDGMAEPRPCWVPGLRPFRVHSPTISGRWGPRSARRRAVGTPRNNSRWRKDLLEALDHGLDTRLGRRVGDGAELSGGQWQKVALERPMMRETPLLLVLDEPTAALDALSEAALFDRYALAARSASRRAAPSRSSSRTATRRSDQPT
jgi:ABC-type dipeptide/oligopeptide/nickel transport system ATPase subunit